MFLIFTIVAITAFTSCHSLTRPISFSKGSQTFNPNLKRFKQVNLLSNIEKQHHEPTHPLKKFVSKYSQFLVAHPYPTKMLSSGIVGGFGDILVQLLTSWRSGSPLAIDMRRLAVFCAVSTLYIAPIIHLWFNWLENFKIPTSMRENKTMKSIVMIILDQTLGAIFIAAGFFYSFEIMQMIFVSRSFSIVSALKAGHEMNRRHLWRTLVVNWYCWPLINFLNFQFVPVHYRLCCHLH